MSFSGLSHCIPHFLLHSVPACRFRSSWASINSLSLPKGSRSCVLSSFTCLLPDIQDSPSQFTHFLPHCADFFLFFLGLEISHCLMVLFLLNCTKDIVLWLFLLRSDCINNLLPFLLLLVPTSLLCQHRWLCSHLGTYIGKPVLVRSNPAPAEVSSQTEPLHRFGLMQLKGW